MYIIPQENYQTMSIENYIELLKQREAGRKLSDSYNNALLNMQKEGC